MLGVKRMYQVTLVCEGLPSWAGVEAALDITKEFAEHRTWHSKVNCDWDGSRLVLRSENDFDSDGKATLDEFRDSIFACVADPGGFRITTQSVQELPYENAQPASFRGRLDGASVCVCRLLRRRASSPTRSWTIQR